MENIEIKLIEYNSPEYEAEVALRYLILRQPLGLVYSEEQLRAEANAYHIGCFTNGKLIGCLILKPIAGKQIQMRQVAVDRMYQRQGLGRKMVSSAEIFSKNLNFREMILHARETAVTFYEKLQYLKVGDSFIEVSIPHWLMVKALQ